MVGIRCQRHETLCIETTNRAVNLGRRAVRNSLLLLLAAFSFLCVGSSAGARCLSYEPTLVSIDGELTTRMVPGPPGYVSIVRGDHPEKVVILVLEAPICVNADPSSRTNSKTHTRVMEVQLVIEKTSYRNLLDKKVRATGSLFQAHSRHHRTPVVLTVKAARAL